MVFEYSCFVSFRHARKPGGDKFITQFHEALSIEISHFLEQEVYVDWERIKGGSFYNESLAKALCKSVCMVMIFTPTYFSEEHSFCAREYRSMEVLEQQRLKLLSSQHRDHGCILPVILRGSKFFPAEIREQRHFYDFTTWLDGGKSIAKDGRFNRTIRDIAERVHQLHQAFEHLPQHPCDQCDGFQLQTKEQVMELIDRVKGKPNLFPGRL